MIFGRDSMQSFQKKTEKCGDIISKEYFDSELQLYLRCNTPNRHTSIWLPINRNPEEKCGHPQHDGHGHCAPSQKDTQPHGSHPTCHLQILHSTSLAAPTISLNA